MSRKGRTLELLVSHLEKLLDGNDDFLIKTPYYMKDNITGVKREFDVALINKNKPSLITVFECRDRTGKQDVTWIEQLKTKRDDLGIEKLIAVSSSSFTKPAIIKAKHNDIEIRLVNEISKKDFADWFLVFFESISLSLDYIGLRLEFYPKMKENFSFPSFNDRIFEVVSLKEKWSFNELVISILCNFYNFETRDELLKYAKNLSKPENIKTGYTFKEIEDEKIYLLHQNQNYLLKRINFKIDLFYKTTKPEKETNRIYSDEKINVLTQINEFELDKSSFVVLVDKNNNKMSIAKQKE